VAGWLAADLSSSRMPRFDLNSIRFDLSQSTVNPCLLFDHASMVVGGSGLCTAGGVVHCRVASCAVVLQTDVAVVGFLIDMACLRAPCSKGSS
jgi:hypothetical protein